jgi:hypothetical protein
MRSAILTTFASLTALAMTSARVVAQEAAPQVTETQVGAVPVATPEAAKPAIATPIAVPRVHRTAFRDRAAMVLIDVGNGVWCAFNPRTASYDVVWRGDVEWRGKVHDFSQDTSRPRGEILRDRTQPVATAPDAVLQPGQTISMRTASGARMPLWHALLIAFDEQGRTPVTVRAVENDGRERLHFQSCTHVTSDLEWQWNFKIMNGPARPASIEWTNTGTSPKPLRAMRLEGEEVTWIDGEGYALTVNWKGYELTPDAVLLRFDLVSKDGTRVEASQRVTAKGKGVRIETSGIPEDYIWFTTLSETRAVAEIGVEDGDDK